MNAVAKHIDQKLYDQDFVAWVDKTAQILRNRQFNELDLEHLIEEVEDMGGHIKRELTNRLAQLIAHLLKWQFQPVAHDHYGRSWKGSIVEQRYQIERLIKKNPSLKPFIAEAYGDSWELGRIIAARETGYDLPVFPEQPTFSYEQAMQEEWLPTPIEK
jgi:hypothetical protein